MDFVQMFLDYLANVRGHSVATVSAYRSDLKHFFDVVKVSPDTVTKLHVQTFIINQKELSRAPRTINRRLNCLSAFFDYLIDELEVNMRRPVRPEYKQKIKDKHGSRSSRVMPDDAKRLMDKVKPLDPVAYMAMLLMGKIGLRISEARKVYIEHFDFGTSKVRIGSSKGRDRYVPVPESVKVEILEYIGMRRAGPLIVHSEAGGAYKTNAGLWKRIRYWMDRLGVPGTPHSWRRMAGTELYKKTKDIVMVQSVLGHESIETTRGSYVDDADETDLVRSKLDDIF